MALTPLATEFLDNFQTCCFCHQKMSSLSNPQLTTCFHSVCFKCANNRKSYCWNCQLPVSVIGVNSVLTTVMKKKSDPDFEISRNEAMSDYQKKEFAELATKVDELVGIVQEKLNQLEEVKVKLKARAILEPARAHEAMRKQIEESKDRTVRELNLEAGRHQKKLVKFVKSNEKECKRVQGKIVVAEHLLDDSAFIAQHPGLLGPLKKSILLSHSPSIPRPLVKFETKLDLRFGMLMSLSFMDAYKRLSKIIPEDVIQKCYCRKLRIDVSNFKPFITHLKNVDRQLPPPPALTEKIFVFSDFNSDECVQMVSTLLSLKQKVRKSDQERGTHIIVKNPFASMEIMKVIFSGGWMLKRTFVADAEILNRLPNEFDYEWTTLKYGDYTFNPRICREAIHRRGLPFLKLTIVLCTDNHQDCEILRAGGAEVVESQLSTAQNSVDSLLRIGKNKGNIIVICNQQDEASVRKLIKSLRVPLYTLGKVFELTMRGWFDRYNPVYGLRHCFRAR